MLDRVEGRLLFQAFFELIPRLPWPKDLGRKVLYLGKLVSELIKATPPRELDPQKHCSVRIDFMLSSEKMLTFIELELY